MQSRLEHENNRTYCTHRPIVASKQRDLVGDPLSLLSADLRDSARTLLYDPNQLPNRSC